MGKNRLQMGFCRKDGTEKRLFYFAVEQVQVCDFIKRSSACVGVASHRKIFAVPVNDVVVIVAEKSFFRHGFIGNVQAALF